MFNPGGLGSMLAQQSSMPDDEFARSAEQSMLRTGKAPITMLADLARRITARKSAMTQQGLQAGAQMRSQPPTLKDQLELEALSLGIGSQPYGYAGGGLVAFQLGGKAEEDSLAAAEEAPLSAGDIESVDLQDAIAEAAGSGTTPITDAQTRDAVRRSGVFSYVETLLGSRPGSRNVSGQKEWDRKAASVS